MEGRCTCGAVRYRLASPEPAAWGGSSLLGFVTVRLRNQLHQVTVRGVEVDPAAAITVIDLARTLAARGGVMADVTGPYARQRRVELRLADEERKVLRPEVLPFVKIEGDAVGRAHRHEMAPFRAGFQVQNVG